MGSTSANTGAGEISENAIADTTINTDLRTMGLLKYVMHEVCQGNWLFKCFKGQRLVMSDNPRNCDPKSHSFRAIIRACLHILAP